MLGLATGLAPAPYMLDVEQDDDCMSPRRCRLEFLLAVKVPAHHTAVWDQGPMIQGEEYHRANNASGANQKTRMHIKTYNEGFGKLLARDKWMQSGLLWCPAGDGI